MTPAVKVISEVVQSYKTNLKKKINKYENNFFKPDISCKVITESAQNHET